MEKWGYLVPSFAVTAFVYPPALVNYAPMVIRDTMIIYPTSDYSDDGFQRLPSVSVNQGVLSLT